MPPRGSRSRGNHATSESQGPDATNLKTTRRGHSARLPSVTVNPLDPPTNPVPPQLPSSESPLTVIPDPPQQPKATTRTGLTGTEYEEFDLNVSGSDTSTADQPSLEAPAEQVPA